MTRRPDANRFAAADGTWVLMRNHELAPGHRSVSAYAAGKEPPALVGDFRSIRGAEKILEPDEDWRLLGTDADPVVAESATATTGVQETDMVD